MSMEVIYKDRRDTDCVKWDAMEEMFGQDDLLAMWVADMDFEAPKCVKDALRQYVDNGVYGYYKVPDSFYDAFIKWEKMYHKYEVKKEWIRFAPGVVPALNWLIQILTKKQDGVLIMPPVYHPFFHAIEVNERRLVTCPLQNEHGVYAMDLENFERKIVEEQVRLFILCSPHNPVGRVWSTEELKAVLDICKKHRVYVISDEIHQDLVIGQKEQIAAATVGEYAQMLVTMTAATKTFNLAGCANSFVIIENEQLRNQFDQFVDQIRVTNGSSFGYIAVQKAYEEGREWIEGVLNMIRENYDYVKQVLHKELPEAIISPLEGTYLAWIDLRSYIPKDKQVDIIQKKCKIAVNFGESFGGEQYEGFIRLNLATRKENVVEAVRRLLEGLQR